jgi:acetyltransferase-like isoleucine patch superfamily enzyme
VTYPLLEQLDCSNCVHQNNAGLTLDGTMRESVIRGTLNRVLQHLARFMPGARTYRVALHRARGVQIGRDVWIGYDAILDTSRPYLITLEDRSSIGMRVTIIAHFRESQGVKIEKDAFVGPGAIILPNVVIGRGAVVTAGSVVTRSVDPMTVVQGNPAVAVARCGVPLGPDVTLKEFSRRLKPLASQRMSVANTSEKSTGLRS